MPSMMCDSRFQHGEHFVRSWDSRSSAPQRGDDVSVRGRWCRGGAAIHGLAMGGREVPLVGTGSLFSVSSGVYARLISESEGSYEGRGEAEWWC